MFLNLSQYVLLKPPGLAGLTGLSAGVTGYMQMYYKAPYIRMYLAT